MDAEPRVKQEARVDAGKTRRKRSKSVFTTVNEHFEVAFNAVLPTQAVFKEPVDFRLGRFFRPFGVTWEP